MHSADAAVLVASPQAQGRRPHLPLPLHEPQIVLTWIARLRWLAVLGQVVAVAVATGVLQMQPPLLPISAFIFMTALTNVALQLALRRRAVQGYLVPLILLLDVCLLTALLYCTGGPDNPFSTLYLVHIAMAVAVLEPRWTWLIIAASAVSYAVLINWHLPLSRGVQPSESVLNIGNWAAVFINAVLIAYFINRIARGLRQREQELISIRERAARNEQLAALTTLAAGAAHELGTPLGTIAVVAKELELEASRISGAESLSEDALLIRREVDRCRVILERMRVDILEDRPTAAAVPIGELIDRLRNDLKPELVPRLLVEVTPGVSEVWAPVRAIQQAVGVLLRNAFDASGKDAKVHLQVEERTGLIVFRVRDRGCGMDPEVLRRAGEPFFTTKPPGKGMGLGLFLVRLVAEKYDGRFAIDSRRGEGTVAELALPNRPHER